MLIEGDKTQYISAEDYESWRKDTLGDAQKIEVEYKPVTEAAK